MEPKMTSRVSARLRPEVVRGDGIEVARVFNPCSGIARHARVGNPCHVMRRQGFTLIEMMVVIGVIIVLAGILIPTVLQARKGARRARIAADLNTITIALEAYQGDFGDFPRLPPNVVALGAPLNQ